MRSVQLAPDMSNKAAFVNGLFAEDVRDPTRNKLADAIASGALTYAYCEPESRGRVLNAWLAAWKASTGGTADPAHLERCCAQDDEWIHWMAGYLARNALDLCVPTLELAHIEDATLATYRSLGYVRHPFRAADGSWLVGSFDAAGNRVEGSGPATVARFLELLFYGAHMVIVSSEKDGAAGIEDAETGMDRALPTRLDPRSSHYGRTGIESGRYYRPAGAPDPGPRGLDVESLLPTAPPGKEPLLFSLLVGATASTHRNGFLQLEGWPAQDTFSPPGGVRHGADFASSTETLWNISTYGACAYSEKRSTPLFLAPSTFDLTLRSDTGMPHYWGANAANVGAAWMHRDRVLLP